MINGLPEISIKYFSELPSITCCLGLHNLFVNVVNTLKPKCVRDQLQWCTGGFVTSWVLTKLTWPSLAESLNSFCSTLVAFRSFILCFLDGYNIALCNDKLYLVKGGLASGSIILTIMIHVI